MLVDDGTCPSGQIKEVIGGNHVKVGGCVYRKPHPPMNSVPPLVAAWLGAISADCGTWPFARPRKGRSETDCQNLRLF